MRSPHVFRIDFALLLTWSLTVLIAGLGLLGIGC